MPKPTYYNTKDTPSTLAVGVHAPYNRSISIDSYFEEFLNLIKTDQIPYKEALFIKLREIDPGYFFSKGKLEDIKKACDTHEIEQVIVSERLSPQQTRNLEDYLNCTVMDRTDLILEIFQKGALSSEGKTQVAIALLQQQKSRLAGKGIHLSQQEGAVGLRGGPGETAKERERRHIESQILRLKQELKNIQRSRDTQRKQRLGRKVSQICLIGYTNAGKSTILNELTKSNVLAEDKLFATLDTTTRALFINGQQKGVLSDTVGFIQQLPPHLIEAFKSTLSELQYADLLLHVVDIADSNWESHIKVVHHILNELDVHKPMLYVFNKADKAPTLDQSVTKIEQYEPHVVISATSRKGIEPLIAYLHSWEPTSA